MVETEEFVDQVDQKLRNTQLKLGFLIKKVLGTGNNGTTLLAFDQ